MVSVLQEATACQIIALLETGQVIHPSETFVGLDTESHQKIGTRLVMVAAGRWGQAYWLCLLLGGECSRMHILLNIDRPPSLVHNDLR
jgi:hypothetical protein